MRLMILKLQEDYFPSPPKKKKADGFQLIPVPALRLYIKRPWRPVLEDQNQVRIDSET